MMFFKVIGRSWKGLETSESDFSRVCWSDSAPLKSGHWWGGGMSNDRGGGEVAGGG